MIKEQVTIQEAVNYLNELLELDSNGEEVQRPKNAEINALIDYAVPVKHMSAYNLRHNTEQRTAFCTLLRDMADAIEGSKQ